MNNLQILTWVLRAHALVLLLALVPIFFPFEWMDKIHGWLGLGELPEARITQYLTRSLSLVYALHGAVCLALTMNMKKYLPFIQLVAGFHFVFGGLSLAIDLNAGMPWFWTIGEGPMIMLFAIFIYFYSAVCLREIEQ